MAENTSLFKCPEEEEKPILALQNELCSNGEIDRCTVVEAAGGDQKSQLETLVAPFDSAELDVKPTVSSSLSLVVSPEMKIEQLGMSHQEVLACVTAQAQAQMQVQAGYSYSSMKLLPVPIKQSLSSSITPSPLCQIPPMLNQNNDICTPEVNQESSSGQNMEFSQILVKTPSPDGYNWRKYGQKLVKGNDRSRSYYRCTHIDCHAKKKVECSDHSGRVVEIIYKGMHNHDPPRKIRDIKKRGLSTPEAVPSLEAGEESETMHSLARDVDSSYPAAASRRKLTHPTPEQKLHSSNDSVSNAIVKSEENCDESRAKRRVKGQSFACADSLCKIVKEPKIVVQATCDAGASGDGYRWRKYGQKMVKGNSNPRSYYKCTSAGCPVRKHVERAADDTSTIKITYEGKHDHDMPVPKKRQDPPSAPLLIAAAPIATATPMENAPLKESEPLINLQSSTPCSMEVEREVATEKASEVVGEKALESARTLLSIGIELGPC